VARQPCRRSTIRCSRKHNPVLSVLIRRAALTGPPLASTLHFAAATNVDERPDGSWHAEWVALGDLARRTAVAASHASELITGLVVDEDRTTANLAAGAGIEAEQQAMADLVGAEPSKEYLGATELIIDRVLARAGQRPGVV
jgi:3-carboxy-cis,cis-muconate cycloisomerase